jgi:hypothetical protein
MPNMATQDLAEHHGRDHLAAELEAFGLAYLDYYPPNPRVAAGAVV